MKKLTFTLNVMYIVTFLFCTLSVQGMESTFVKTMADKQDHMQVALAAEKYNDTHCLLTSLLPELLIEILSHCHVKKKQTLLESHKKNEAQSLKKNIKSFMQMNTVCKHFNQVLTCETIGSLCKNYAQRDKNALMEKLAWNLLARGDRNTKRLPILILVCAGADTDKSRYLLDVHLLLDAVILNDTELAVTLFKHHADPNTRTSYGDPVFFRAKTIEMAQLFIDNGVNVHATDNWTSPRAYENFEYNVLRNTIYQSFSSELMKFYLNHYVDATKLNCQSHDCLLHILAHSNPFEHVENIENFLEKGKLLLNAIPHMINALNKDGKTPLDIAQNTFETSKKLERGTPEAFEQLITLFREHGGLTAQELIDLKSPENLYTLIEKILAESNEFSVHKLLQTHITAGHITQESIQSALYTASAGGNVNSLRIMLAALDDSQALEAIFCADKFGRTPLHSASCNGRYEAVEILINTAGQRSPEYVCMQDSDGYTPLMLSLINCETHIAQLNMQAAGDKLWNLLSAKTKEKGETALHLACARNNTDFIMILYNTSKDKFKDLLLKGDQYGYLSLHYAAEYGDAKIIELLMKLYNQIKLDIDEDLTFHHYNASGSTPLHYAAQKGCIKAAQVLIAHALNPLELIFEQKHGRHTALHIAAANGHANMVQLLLQAAGASTQKLSFMQNAMGFTAIHGAIRNDHLDVVKTFAQEAIKNNWLYDLLNIQDKYDKTPLARAKIVDKKEIISFLENLSSIECSLCLETKELKDCHTMSNCSEKTGCKSTFCKECLLQHITTHLDEGSTHGLTCPNVQCGKKMHESDIQMITQNNKELYDRFDTIALKEHIAGIPNIKYCQTPNCKFSFILEENIQRFKVQCSCNQTYCSHCLFNHNLKITCEQAQEERELAQDPERAHAATQKWIAENTKPCPQCKTAIQKNGGCYWMRCKKCLHEFCWKCLQPHDHTLNHPCGLWENNAQMDQANQALIDQLAQPAVAEAIQPLPMAMADRLADRQEQPVANQFHQQDQQEDEDNENENGEWEYVD